MTPASPHLGEGGCLRVRLDLGYDGADFSGWAAQPGQRTVQGELEAALGKVLRLDPPRLTVAGRTDAGVHARGQVCHVDLDADAFAAVVGRSDRRPEDALVTRLAGVLPTDVAVHRASVVSFDFDARFAATGRRYSYRVADTPGRPDPLLRGHVLWHRRPLDLDAMNEAALQLLGEQDFAAYCRPREGATTIRTLHALRWTRAAGGVAEATIAADAFCHNQVRAMVGALLAVGEGRRPTSWPGEVLAARTRDPAVAVVAPHALVLEEVTYPPPEQWADRARQARNRRELPADVPASDAPPAASDVVPATDVPPAVAADPEGRSGDDPEAPSTFPA